jgi:hypothetical protein
MTSIGGIDVGIYNELDKSVLIWASNDTNEDSIVLAFPSKFWGRSVITVFPIRND